ncbi:MAG: type II toxin-antitoxin system Phd/YefM family antitoxin [Oscillospiraceae bacterium]|jgi:prevent-host-death family protein|nr:type II toxin-antitoxin system Phd/YefM family antitoxin [Oscillospiraceae bacterium]
MPQIIPIRDLKKTAEISEMCRMEQKPIYITKNGYGDMVIMSMETFERAMLRDEIYRELEAGQKDFENGKVKDAFQSLDMLRAKHGV